jgi:hypothetical protein
LGVSHRLQSKSHHWVFGFKDTCAQLALILGKLCSPDWINTEQDEPIELPLMIETVRKGSAVQRAVATCQCLQGFKAGRYRSLSCARRRHQLAFDTHSVLTCTTRAASLD